MKTIVQYSGRITLTVAIRDEDSLTIVKTGSREWTVSQGDTKLRIFKKLCWAKLYVVKNVGRKCPCGALTYLGPTLPCFEDSDQCLPCQNDTLERMTNTLFESKW